MEEDFCGGVFDFFTLGQGGHGLEFCEVAGRGIDMEGGDGGVVFGVDVEGFAGFAECHMAGRSDPEI